MWSRYRYVFLNSQETRMRANRGGLLRGLEGRYEILHPGVDWGSCQLTGRYDSYFLVPGRIMWTKGIETAIKAFVHFRGMSPAHGPFRLIVAGRVDKKSEPYLARLREQARGRDDIEFVVSPTDQMLHRLYADCYAALFPAFNEDWGMAPLEANAFGKAVIASNRGGPAESQVDGETGFLVPAEPEAFARAMAVLAADEHLARTMGRAGRERVRRYDWSHFVTRIDDVLEGVAK
jgi:glycosyltransferase involved in cell wall biosynthesis